MLSGDRIRRRRERFSTSIPIQVIPQGDGNGDNFHLKLYEGPIFHTRFLIRANLERLTLEKIVNEAIDGIIEEGVRQGKKEDAKQLVQGLEKVKHLAQPAKSIYEVPDQIGQACIKLYTKDSFWFGSMNSLLWDQGKITNEQMKTFAPFCFLLRQYLHQIETTNILTVYRGVQLTDKQIEQYKNTTNLFHFTAFTSTSTDNAVAECFSENTMFIIDLNAKSRTGEIQANGAYIAPYSQFRDEEEFLLWPMETYQVTRWEKDPSTNKHRIYLKVIARDQIHSLLQSMKKS